MRAETVPMVKQFLVYSASSRSRMASSRSLVRFSNAALSANNITQIEAVLSVQRQLRAHDGAASVAGNG